MDIVLYSIGFSVFLACLLVIAAIYSKKTIVKTELAKKELEIEHQKELVEQLIAVQEDERSRIARDLHDGVNSKLATVLLFLEQPSKNNNSERVPEAIKEAMQISRRISYDLLPPTLESFGLKGALYELFEDIEEESRIHVTIQLADEIDEIPQKKQLHVYRIVQECLQNTLKYGKANSIELTGVYDKELLLTFRDNGVGVDLTMISRHGLGLRNIAARAEMIPAKHVFKSEPGQGFQTQLTIQL
jgi:two-component system, NarL family, sensor kinase